METYYGIIEDNTSTTHLALANFLNKKLNLNLGWYDYMEFVRLCIGDSITSDSALFPSICR